jgi:uncharacterized protein YjiS (DUF1127 family)
MLIGAHHCRHAGPAYPIWSWPIPRALRNLCDALREAVTAHRRYEWLKSRGAPHETALKEALSIGHSACECSAARLVVLTHKEVSGRSAISSRQKNWLHTIALWIARSRQRRALEEIAGLNDRLLKDIGVSKDEALREAAKPFWR